MKGGFGSSLTIFGLLIRKAGVTLLSLLCVSLPHAPGLWACHIGLQVFMDSV